MKKIGGADSDMAKEKGTTGSPEGVLRTFDSDVHSWAANIVNEFDTIGEGLCGYEEV